MIFFPGVSNYETWRTSVFPCLKKKKQQNCYLLRQLRGEMSYDPPSLCPPSAQPGLRVYQAPAPHSGSPRLPFRVRCAPFALPSQRGTEQRPTADPQSAVWPGRLARWPSRTRGGGGRVRGATWGCAACAALFSDVARDGGLTLYCDFVHEDLFVTGCFCYIAHPPLFPELLCAFKKCLTFKWASEAGLAGKMGGGWWFQQDGEEYWLLSLHLLFRDLEIFLKFAFQTAM